MDVYDQETQLSITQQTTEGTTSSQPTVGTTASQPIEGTISSLNNNNEDQNAPIAANQGATYSDT